MANEIDVDVDDVIISGNKFEVTLSVKKPRTPAAVELTLKVSGVSHAFEIDDGSTTHPSSMVQKLVVGAEMDWTVSNWGAANTGQKVVIEATEIGGMGRRAQDAGTVV